MPQHVNSSSGPYVQYRRGDLRQSFIEGARIMVREVGENGFSLNQLSRELGVSPAAAYRHFRNRDEILAAVCDDGYRRLGEALERNATADEEGINAVIGVGSRYVAFAVQNPDLFSMMFRRPPDYESAEGPKSFGALVTAVVASQATGGMPAGDPVRVAGSVWVSVHGIAVLHLGGGLAAVGIDGGPEQMVRDVLLLQYPQLGGCTSS